jgi:hypothetical protein
MDISSLTAAVSMQALQASEQIALMTIKQGAKEESLVMQALAGGSAQAAPQAGKGSILDISV